MSKRRVDGSLVGYQDPAYGAAVVVPSDTADLAEPGRCLYLGVGGDVRVTLAGMSAGESVVYRNCGNGWSRAMEVTRVWSTGTTARSMVVEF